MGWGHALWYHLCDEYKCMHFLWLIFPGGNECRGAASPPGQRKPSPALSPFYCEQGSLRLPPQEPRGGSPVSGPFGLDFTFPRILVSQGWAGLREAIRMTFSCFLLISPEIKGLQLSPKHFLASQHHLKPAVLLSGTGSTWVGKMFLSCWNLPRFAGYLSLLSLATTCKYSPPTSGPHQHWDNQKYFKHFQCPPSGKQFYCQLKPLDDVTKFGFNWVSIIDSLGWTLQ